MNTRNLIIIAVLAFVFFYWRKKKAAKANGPLIAMPEPGSGVTYTFEMADGTIVSSQIPPHATKPPIYLQDYVNPESEGAAANGAAGSGSGVIFTTSGANPIKPTFSNNVTVSKPASGFSGSKFTRQFKRDSSFIN